MKVIRPNCRAQFTTADYAFIATVLPVRQDGSAGLIRLLEDADDMDRLLDQPRLFRAVLDLPSCLSVSLHFYFYVLVRHALLRADIQDRDVADYVAEMLAEFSQLQRLSQPRPDGEGTLDYLHEMLAALERLEQEERFALQCHIGNYALFQSGLFPGRVQRRSERRAAPGFGFYEELVSAYYRMAGGHWLARRMDLAPVFSTLGEAFHVTRLALNHLSEKLLFLESDRAVRDLLREIERAESGENGDQY
jgi:hypothetical protein